MPQPTVVVAAQVDAYNARDLERFVAFYASDIIIDDGTGQVLVHGHDGLRALYGPLFAQSPDLRCEIRQRIEVGEYVVDEESVSGVCLDGFPADLRAAAVYRVVGDNIVHVRLLM